MYGLDDQRYQLGTEIKTAQQGALFQGFDLSLKRNVLLYQFTDLSDEEALQLIRNVDGFNHPSFFHILDVSHGARGLLVALELREGVIATTAPKAAHFSFEQCLEMTLKIGKLVEIAMSEGIRDYSLSADNLWLTDDGQLMIINFWTKGSPKHRGAVGLFHLLYQLLSRSTEIPESADEISQNLHHIQQAHSLSDRDLDILNQLFREAFIQSSPSFSFTLLLSQLLTARIEADKPIPAPASTQGEGSPEPEAKQWYQPFLEQMQQFRKEWLSKKQLDKLRIPIAWLKKIRIPTNGFKKERSAAGGQRSRKPMFAAAAFLLVVITVPILIFASKGDKPTASTELAVGALLDTEEQGTEPAAGRDKEESLDQPASQRHENRDTPAFAEDRPMHHEEDEDQLDVTDEEEMEEAGAEQDGMIYVPSLFGLSQQEAEQAALSAGLRYSFYIVANEEETPGLVFEQDLEPGSTVTRGTRVTFWINRG